MVARNEESRYLEVVLDRLSTQVDLIVLTDDCSDDRTADIAESKGAKVNRLDTPMFTVSEGRFRQTAWEYLESFAEPGDWILAIDADEMFYPTQKLPLLLEQQAYDVLGITFYHMWNETQYRADKAWKPPISSRLFRFFPGGNFMDRRLACGAEPTYVIDLIRRGRFIPNTGFAMKHLGYARDEDKIAKHKRYMELDKGEFHSITHLNSIRDDRPQLLDWRDPR